MLGPVPGIQTEPKRYTYTTTQPAIDICERLLRTHFGAQHFWWHRWRTVVRPQTPTYMTAESWGTVVWTKKVERHGREIDRLGADLVEIARRKVEEDEAVKRLEKEEKASRRNEARLKAKLEKAERERKASIAVFPE